MLVKLAYPATLCLEVLHSMRKFVENHQCRAVCGFPSFARCQTDPMMENQPVAMNRQSTKWQGNKHSKHFKCYNAHKHTDIHIKFHSTQRRWKSQSLYVYVCMYLTHPVANANVFVSIINISILSRRKRINITFALHFVFPLANESIDVLSTVLFPYLLLLELLAMLCRICWNMPMHKDSIKFTTKHIHKMNFIILWRIHHLRFELIAP